MPDRGESFATPPATYYWDMSIERDNKDVVSGEHSIVNRIENSLSEFATAVYTYDNRYVFNFSARLDDRPVWLEREGAGACCGARPAGVGTGELGWCHGSGYCRSFGCRAGFCPREIRH